MNPGNLNASARKFVSGFMTMGENGMADMGAMSMRVPTNSVPMIGMATPKDYITMGGMYTNLKVRAHLDSYDHDPGWYEDPPGTLATVATREEIERDLGGGNV
jgi:hypothetical protein